jgi:glycosyltransferase involved in cell wall biosynthesis
MALPSAVNGRTYPLPAAVPRVSVVIPTLNESKNLPYVFGRLPPDLAEVVVVDGGSVDGTVAVARALRPDVRIVRQTRTGKGNALACGFAACTGDMVVMIDADGSTDPQEIPAFVAALRDGADYAKGSRFCPGGGSEDITPVRRLGNAILNGIVNRLFGTRFTDLCYGYNAFWRDVIPGLELPDAERTTANGERVWGDGFEIETLLNIRAACTGLAIQEVSSVEARRLHGECNLRVFADGRRILGTIATEYRRARRRAARRPRHRRPTSVAVAVAARFAAQARADNRDAGER